MEIEKSARLLYLYQDFIKGVGIQKKAAADRFGVNERSLQRDIEDLRCFFANQTPPGEIIYDARQKVYRLIERDNAHLSNNEVLAVCKILLESRSLRRDEMLPILDKLVSCCVPAEQRRVVVDMLANEKHLYIEPHHGKHLLDCIAHLPSQERDTKLAGGQHGFRALQIHPKGILPGGVFQRCLGFLPGHAPHRDPADDGTFGISPAAAAQQQHQHKNKKKSFFHLQSSCFFSTLYHRISQIQSLLGEFLSSSKNLTFYYPQGEINGM